MKKQISAIAAVALLATVAACGSTPTSSTAATPSAWQADSAPADSTGRIPNMIGSGN